jgi:hypothetical protein
VGIENASLYELGIDALLLVGLWALWWLKREARLSKEAMDRQGIANGRRTEIRIERIWLWGSLYVLGGLLVMMGYYTFAVPDNLRPELETAVRISQAIFATFIIAMVGPAVYAATERRKKLKKYEAEAYKGIERREKQT